jgi:pimeloyl-ACP methyl ester carboxylesterase
MRAWYADTVHHTFGDITTPVRDDGDGEVICCLHGFPTTSWDFEPLWPTLTAEHRAIAFDLLGLGRASKPDRPMTIGDQADLTEDILVSRGVTQAHLFAHDLGDTVAQELLARQAEGSAKVRWLSVVLLNGGLFPETHRARFIQKVLISPLGRWVAQLSSERVFRRNMTNIFGPGTPPSEDFLRNSWALMVSDGGRTALPHLIRYMAERRTHRERWVRPLQDRIVPVRLINGSVDPVSGRHMAGRYAALVPDADVVHLPDLGHYPHVEQPESVAEHLRSFFSAHRANAV